MPTKGTKLKTGERLRLVTPKFYRHFLKANPNINITYVEFSEIINTCNEISGLKVLENTDGFKMPENMGYLAVTKYKSSRRPIDFKRTRELGKVIYHTNFHSYGYMNRIVWFSSQITKCKFHQIYKFIPERKVSRELAKKTLTGKIYNEFDYTHFKTRKLRINFDKKFK